MPTKGREREGRGNYIKFWNVWAYSQNRIHEGASFFNNHEIMKGDVKDVLLHSGLQRQHKDAFSELLVQKQTGNFETAVCRLRSSPQVWFKSINETNIQNWCSLFYYEFFTVVKINNSAYMILVHYTGGNSLYLFISLFLISHGKHKLDRLNKYVKVRMKLVKAYWKWDL